MIDWKDAMPKHSSRVRESIEWSITYAYNTERTDLPRLLLIGDSICNGYHGAVGERLQGKFTESFWASSKCVTDPDYFRDLYQILEAAHYGAICFNNGLHSLETDIREWEEAYCAAVAMIMENVPGARLYLVTSTPLKDPALTVKAERLNQIVVDTAKRNHLSVIDLFSIMNPLDREEYWSDTFHYKAPAIAMQADLIAGTVSGNK